MNDDYSDGVSNSEYNDSSLEQDSKNDREVVVENVDFNLKVIMNSGHKGLIRTIKLDPTEQCKFYLTGSDDTTIRIWSTSKLKDNDSQSKHYQASLIGGHQMPITDLLVNELQTNEVYSCSVDKLALKWDLNQRKITNHFFGHSASILTIADHPSIRDLIFTGSKDRTCKVWDARSKNKSLLTLTGHKDTVNKVLTFPTEPQVVTCSNDKTIRFYDLRNASKCTKIISYHSNPIRTLCKGSVLEGSAFVSASVNQLFSWDPVEGIPLTEFQIDTTNDNTGVINSMDVIDHGKHLLINTSTGFKMFDYFSGKKIHINLNNDDDVHANIQASAFNQKLVYNGDDSKRLVISGTEKQLKIYTV